MSTRLREREEKIEHILELLIGESEKGTPIIVEGKNDVESLRELRVQGRIISAKTGGKSLLDVMSEIEKTGAREVILLLDFDKRGREGTDALKKQLETARIKTDLTFWNGLLRVAGRELKDIEGLAAYIQTLKKKIGEE